MTKKSDALRTFDNGFNCSQAVFSAYAESLGLSRQDALRVAASFGGGIGRSGNTCGVVTGALMALGLRYGATEPDQQAKERMYAIAQEFMARFTARHGSVICRELVQADISTPEGRQAMRERNTHASVCSGLVEDAVAILDEMLHKEERRRIRR